MEYENKNDGHYFKYKLKYPVSIVDANNKNRIKHLQAGEDVLLIKRKDSTSSSLNWTFETHILNDKGEKTTDDFQLTRSEGRKIKKASKIKMKDLQEIATRIEPTTSKMLMSGGMSNVITSIALHSFANKKPMDDDLEVIREQLKYFIENGELEVTE